MPFEVDAFAAGLPPKLEWSFTPELTASRLAREAMRSILGDDVIAPPAMLVVSELVSNVVRHARTEGVLRVWDVPAIRLRVEVTDLGGRLPSISLAPGPLGGQGLRLVDRLANRWGAETSHGHTRVWAEFDRAEPGSP